MSLISDALKKARAEAARQDSLRQGMPYAIGVADAPVRRPPWLSLLAGLGAGCLLAAGVFAVAFFAGWGPFHKPVAETRAATVAETSVAPPATLPAIAATPPSPAPATLPTAPREERPAPAPTLSPLPAPPAPAKPLPETPRQPAPQAETPPAPRNPAPEPAPAAATAEPPAPIQAAPSPAAPSQPASPAPAPSAASGGLVEGNTYAGEVPVPGGGSVKLNGIVFSPDHPIAVLDGRVMGPGESAQGFTVLAIESGRVKLQGHGVTVYLSPK
jgi:hypothetical protein